MTDLGKAMIAAQTEVERLRTAVETCAAEFDKLSRDGTKTMGVQNIWKIVAERVRHILDAA